MVESATKDTGEEDDHEHRLGQKTDHPRPAGAHRPVGIGRIDRRQGGEEASQRQHEPAPQHVAHEGEKQRVAGQHGNQQRDENRRHEDHIRGKPKNPRALLGDHLVLLKQLVQVPIRLKNARTALGLDNFLEPVEHSEDQRREHHHHQHLQQVE